MRKKVRTLRHWKQRFDRDAEFIWRCPLTYGGECQRPGDPIPPALMANKAKLRRFWESGTIELAQFEEPNVLTGQPTPSENMMRELALTQARARAARATDDFADAEDAHDSPMADDESWLGGPDSEEPVQ